MPLYDDAFNLLWDGQDDFIVTTERDGNTIVINYSALLRRLFTVVGDIP